MCPRGAAVLTPTTDPTLQWHKRARSAWESSVFPEMRFRTPWGDDEMAVAVRTAREWISHNPCPDDATGQQLIRMLDAYAEMSRATVARFLELRQVVEQLAVSVWGLPGAA